MHLCELDMLQQTRTSTAALLVCQRGYVTCTAEVWLSGRSSGVVLAKGLPLRETLRTGSEGVGLCGPAFWPGCQQT